MERGRGDIAESSIEQGACESSIFSCSLILSAGGETLVGAPHPTALVFRTPLSFMVFCKPPIMGLYYVKSVIGHELLLLIVM